jgi:ATPase family protein associated with various cellular activities (AAA)
VSEISADLERELQWLSALIEARLRLYFSECRHKEVRDLPPPDLSRSSSAYSKAVRGHSISFEERAVLALALAPHLRPQVLDAFLIRNSALDRVFTEFGGAATGSMQAFWPTLETAAFILAGADLERRLAVQELFTPGHFFREQQILLLDETQPAQSIFAAPLCLTPECLVRLTTGGRHRPQFSGAFPAQRITTRLAWSDLVLPGQVMEEIEEIKAWIEHRQTLLTGWGLARQIKPGFRSLFYGPPGTGKTLTASLLGKSTGLDVYRIDLSLVVSKYIGETEKNLAKVFDQAERNDWILFFDEADALFGKRTQTASAHDRYANQEVAYLLQRIEDFSGVVILASNLKGNLDEAFARRFQSMIYFPMPGPDERAELWRLAFSTQCRLETSVDLARLAEEFEISGGGIVNVLRSSSLATLRHGRSLICMEDIHNGIRREFRKDGKMV